MTTVNTRQKSISAIDTHCHVQMPQYDADRAEVIARAVDAGIGMVCVGVDLESSQSAIALAEKYEGLWCSVGLHPNDNLTEAYDNAAYKDLAMREGVVAIGEIGLDYYRTTDAELRGIQKERFLKQLELAHEVSKPVIIHCRDAHHDMRGILATAGTSGVIHSFNGTTDDMSQYLAYGYFIGMNAIVTYSPQYEDIVRAVPLDRLVLETDSPYLSPAPYRGKRNEPVHILKVAELIARIRNESLDVLLAQTRANSQLLLNIEIVGSSKDVY